MSDGSAPSSPRAMDDDEDEDDDCMLDEQNPLYPENEQEEELEVAAPAEVDHSRRRAAAAAEAAATSMRAINERSNRPQKGDGKRLAAMMRGETTTAPTKDSEDEAGTPKIPGSRATALRRPGSPTRSAATGKISVLQKRPLADADESYSEHEKALNEFLQLHPMLSLDSTTYRTLQLVSDLVAETSIPTRELEVVPRSHDESYLRPPDTRIGERPCCLGDRCICVWLARWRHGDSTDLAFIGTEFLLPSQKEVFMNTGKLPSVSGKCLVCTRYYHTYIYRLARSDPTFNPSRSVSLQAFGNVLDPAVGDVHPSHCSVVHDVDGYRSDAMLFVDEAWAETQAARGPMGTFLWRPCVRFCSSHYHYVRDASSGLPRMVQRDVAS